MDPYKQVDWFIEYQQSQGQSSPEVPDSAGGKTPATSDTFPEGMKLNGVYIWKIDGDFYDGTCLSSGGDTSGKLKLVR